MKHKVYIVVATYNGLAWIQKCLSSCKGYPVIVVDNSSTDQTVSYIKQNFPEVVILPQSKNLGFGQANNIGISYALKKGAEHFFLLNQDAYIVNDSLSKLVAFQKEHSDYGILSPIHLNSSCDKMDFQFSNYVSYNKNKSFYSDFVLQNEIKPVYDVPFVNAAAWLINKKCVNTVGVLILYFFTMVKIIITVSALSFMD